MDASNASNDNAGGRSPRYAEKIEVLRKVSRQEITGAEALQALNILATEEEALELEVNAKAFCLREGL